MWRVRALLLSGLVLPGVHAQARQQPAGTSAEVQSLSTAEQSLPTFTLTTREVVVDVLATDHHDHPLDDLKASDFEVFELGAKFKRTVQVVTGFRVVDPAARDEREADDSGGLHVKLGSGCTERSAVHYEIAYRVSPDRMGSGEHEILVTTSRRDAKLAFGSRYAVGGTRPVADPRPSDRKKTDDLLMDAACYHPPVPLSLPLTAHLTQQPDVLQYQVVIPPEALGMASLSVDARHVQLEFGACVFGQDGRMLRFSRMSTERTLSSGEYVQAVLQGLPSRIELSRADDPAFVRFAVRDLLTGNLGVVTASAASPLRPGELTTAEAAAKARWDAQSKKGRYADLVNFPLPGPIGSFGAIQPRRESLCGDVYELPEGTDSVPNFRSLESVGSVFTYLLDVPHQQFWNTGGVPGVTRKTDWFGIDYRGAFWVTAPGEYVFTLYVDDGAKLYVDDGQVVNADGRHNGLEESGKVWLAAGRHTLHVPYYQGRPTSVALQLFVKPPGGEMELFDVRAFAKPAAKPAS